MTWVLILSLIGAEGMAMTSVPGFTSKEQCIEAARVASAELDSPLTTVRAVCAPQGGK